MTKIRDYECVCGSRFEYLHHGEGDGAACSSCGSKDLIEIACCAKPFHVIVPMSNTSLKHKAGFVHSHGDRPAEKGSVAVPRTGAVK